MTQRTRNHPLFSAVAVALIALTHGITHSAHSVEYPEKIESIEEFNEVLPYWGTSWRPVSNARSMYHPSFYTGFAMRSQSPERIHIRQARGNQTRITVILDEDTISDYLFDLVKRHEVYQKLLTNRKITLLPESAAVPVLRYFGNIVESETYGIKSFFISGESDPVAVYKKSLEVLKALNPGRVFELNLDLTKAFLKWRASMKATIGGAESVDSHLANASNQIRAINSLLWGRINFVDAPSAEIKALLSQTAQLAFGEETEFLSSALALFKATTGTKYEIKRLESESLVPALDCNDLAKCRLTYPEFTTIYPTGSWRSSTSDRHGNRINAFASPGLWDFYKRGGTEPDRIDLRKPYYGYVPKMYYQSLGNAYHNPGLRFSYPSASTKRNLDIDPNHNVLWAVKRGAVSHGCSRLASGHMWEMRHILPVQSDKIYQVNVFINSAKDFDVFDVDGDGESEIMGVEYYITYGLKNNDYYKREAAQTEITRDQKYAFYQSLFGRNKVFSVDSNGELIFHNPSVSHPSYLDYRKVGARSSEILEGDFGFYEQRYEQDKIQFFNYPSPSISFIRALGRVRGCRPNADKDECGENSFNATARSAFGLSF